MVQINFESPGNFSSFESDAERDLRIDIIKFEGKTLLKLLNQYGHPKNEIEEENIWQIIEERENNNKKINDKINNILTNGDF